MTAALSLVVAACVTPQRVVPADSPFAPQDLVRIDGVHEMNMGFGIRKVRIVAVDGEVLPEVADAVLVEPGERDLAFLLEPKPRVGFEIQRLVTELEPGLRYCLRARAAAHGSSTVVDLFVAATDEVVATTQVDGEELARLLPAETSLPGSRTIGFGESFVGDLRRRWVTVEDGRGVRLRLELVELRKDEQDGDRAIDPVWLLGGELAGYAYEYDFDDPRTRARESGVWTAETTVRDGETTFELWIATNGRDVVVVEVPSGPTAISMRAELTGPQLERLTSTVPGVER